MKDNKTDVQISADVTQAVNVIKSAILQSQSRAVRMISGTQLSLYFGVGLYAQPILARELGEPQRLTR